MIKGRVFLYVIITSIITTISILVLGVNYKLILEIFISLHIILNITGIICMISNYKRNNIDDFNYYWDLDHWYPLNQKEIEKIKKEHYWHIDIKYPYIMHLSVVCWLVYGFLLIQRWFDKNLTIRL